MPLPAKWKINCAKRIEWNYPWRKKKLKSYMRIKKEYNIYESKYFCMCNLWDAFVQVYDNSFKSMTSQVRKRRWQRSVHCYLFLQVWFIWLLRWCRLTKKVIKTLQHKLQLNISTIYTVQNYVWMNHMNHLHMRCVKSNPWNSTAYFVMGSST